MQSDKLGFISTHAPAGGATVPRYLYMSSRVNFYSRPCGRGDVKKADASGKPTIFLLTPLREGRRSCP